MNPSGMNPSGMNPIDSRPTPSHSLQDFVESTAERDQPGDVFELESDRMLEVNVRAASGRSWAPWWLIAAN
jgi:hypothetical protein